MLRPQFRRRRSDEEGSIILAVLVVMVVAGLLVALLSLTDNGLKTARTDQDRTNAFQFANAGMDQAVYRIDRGAPTTKEPSGCTGLACTYVPTLAGAVVTGFTDRVTVGNANFSITAAQDPPGQSTTWKVRALGKDPSGRRRQAIATVTANPLFANGFFVMNDFELSGNQQTPVAYRSSVCPDASCAISPAPGRIGTNGTFDGSGVPHFAQYWEGFNMYGRATPAAAEAACNGCPVNPVNKVHGITERLEPAVPAQPVSAICPGSIVSGAMVITGVVQPNDYVCNMSTTLGAITVGSAGNGSGIVRLWLNGNVVLKGPVNPQKQTKKFQVFVPEKPGGGAWPTTQNQGFCGGPGRFAFWGLLYAPGLEFNCQGSHQPLIYGAVLVNLHSGTGNQFEFHWDIDSMDALNDGRYVIKDWRECPPATTDC